ncbi:trimethyllysine dioxygenase, mitochondrial-like [Rhopilema esculentum]|uniref:trimethyllysine dioxygenase, mitochondrial-like n=1 Tax=Rhopilema esculentum TaxID=499914 RepID=UPI0031CFD602
MFRKIRLCSLSYEMCTGISKLTIATERFPVLKRSYAAISNVLERTIVRNNGIQRKFPGLTGPFAKRHLSYKAPSSSKLVACHENSQGLNLMFSNGQAAQLHYFWLRDHCTCQECYHPQTFQKLVDTYQIPLDIRPKSVTSREDSLTVEWPDGHKSTFTSSWLNKNKYGQSYHCFDVKEIEKHLWNKERFRGIEDSLFDEVIKSDEKLLEYLEKIVKYGIAFIDGIEEPYKESLEKIANRIGHIQLTHYGDMWTFVSGGFEFADTAYLSIKLEGHNDGTYFYESPGLQTLHCDFHTGEGGENVFVDGFYVAEKLKETDPEAYTFLATKKIPSVYYEKDAFLFKAYDTVLKLDDFDNEIYQIRFNPNDRDVLSCLSFEEVEKFYKASHSLTRLIRDPSNELVVKPRPGRAAIFDNWRVFHARNSYTGQRSMSGFYMQRHTFLSKIHALREKLFKAS